MRVSTGLESTGCLKLGYEYGLVRRDSQFIPFRYRLPGCSLELPKFASLWTNQSRVAKCPGWHEDELGN